jgi:hypothetical protein
VLQPWRGRADKRNDIAARLIQTTSSAHSGRRPLDSSPRRELVALTAIFGPGCTSAADITEPVRAVLGHPR